MKTPTVLVQAAVLSLLTTTSLQAHAWTRNLTFEEGTVGAKAQSSSGQDFDDACGGCYITDEQVLSGNKAAKLTVTGGATAFGEWGGIVNHPEDLRKGDEIWFSVNTYFPPGFNYDSTGQGGHLKFLRVLALKSSGANSGFNDWYMNPEASAVPHKFIYEGQQEWFEFGDPSDEVQRGKWEHYEMYIKFDNVPVDQGGTAMVRVWKNGRLLREITGSRTLNEATNYSPRSHLFTYWNGGAPKTQHMYVDNIVVTSDTPSNRDQYGNPMVGAAGSGGGAGDSRPEAPQLNVE
ncbi:polysaccharide lyase [Marinobacter sp. F4206]|uniref:polysaccharide lyase n=1 Tax=Marinobacter sp. F4206 TaxID=2861777 RepID=UPI001C5EE377|nr:polysaccharide lyase [Marinobacter sp. F4206]MBW4933406.1 polysaccharide lyase [Marinobacter sp. F4206]